MKNIIIHCFHGRNDQKKLLQKLSFVKPTTLKHNHYSIFANYKPKYNTKVKSILKKYRSRNRICLLKSGHALDGNLRSHLRINSDSEKIQHDENDIPMLKSDHLTTPNYGNLPTKIASYYNFPTQTSPSSPPKIGIISLGGTYLTTDINTYWTTYLGRSGTPTLTYVNGISGSTNAPNQKIKSNDGSDENTLDIEITLGVCPAAHVTMYFGTNTIVGFYNAIARAISDNNTIISISWGAPEAAFGTSYLNSYNQLLQLAESHGIAVSVAAGDNGSTDGGSTLALDFPSSSPYAISCGGTSIPSLSSPTETVWSWNAHYGWGSGGGLSNFFKWTRNVSYPALNSTTPNLNTLISTKPRSSPDIALLADPLNGFTIYFNKTLYISAFGGTSCVAPAFSGLLGLINKTFTTHNPTDLLYLAYTAAPTAFKDITTGTNDSLTHGVNVFNARVGYDQCSGLGSINGTLLANYLHANN